MQFNYKINCFQINYKFLCTRPLQLGFKEKEKYRRKDKKIIFNIIISGNREIKNFFRKYTKSECFLDNEYKCIKFYNYRMYILTSYKFLKYILLATYDKNLNN